MATTTFREDYLGRNLIDPTSDVLDYVGRTATSTVDYMGRGLRRVVRANTTTYATGTEIQFTGGTKYIVKVGGQTAGSPPAVPALYADVTDGAATLTRTD